MYFLFKYQLLGAVFGAILTVEVNPTCLRGGSLPIDYAVTRLCGEMHMK